jgi:Tol biopolymer transport system component
VSVNGIPMRFKPLLSLLFVALAACGSPQPAPPPTASVLTQAAAIITPTFPATAPPTATFAPTSAPISELGLSGRLLFTQGIQGLWQIDLSTGEQTQLWAVPERAYLGGVGASPDGSRLALAYSPPPPEDTPQLGATSLYLAEGDGSNPQAVLEPTVQFESFISPAWSPDGEWLYYTHYLPVYNDEGTFSGLILNIERMPAEGGPSETVIEGAQQGALSGDGTQIVYLRFDLDTYATGLWIAGADGSNPRELLPDNAFFALSGPHLSPDGTRIAFGASGPLQTASLTPTTRAAGMARPPAAIAGRMPASPAKHGPPWEVWEISPEGGRPTQLTQLYTDGPWPVWSPDGASLAILQPGGVLLWAEQAADPVFLGPAVGHGEIVWVE